MEWVTGNWITMVPGIVIGLHLYWLLSRHVGMGCGSHGHAAPPKDPDDKVRGKPTSPESACH